MPRVRGELEHLDLPTRRTQEPELGGRDLGIVEHQRVELVQREPLAGRLDYDQAAVISKPASAAFSVEELQQAQALLMVLAPAVRAVRFEVLGSLPLRVSRPSGGGEACWMIHPMDDGSRSFRIQRRLG